MTRSGWTRSSAGQLVHCWTPTPVTCQQTGGTCQSAPQHQQSLSNKLCLHCRPCFEGPCMIGTPASHNTVHSSLVDFDNLCPQISSLSVHLRIPVIALSSEVMLGVAPAAFLWKTSVFVLQLGGQHHRGRRCPMGSPFRHGLLWRCPVRERPRPPAAPQHAGPCAGALTWNLCVIHRHGYTL